jgi:hypothetical protein
MVRQNLAEESFALGGVHQARRRWQADDIAESIHNAVAKRMARRSVKSLGFRRPDQRLESLSHLLRALDGERERQNGGWVFVEASGAEGPDQPRDARDDDACLAGPGSGQDDKGAALVIDGFPLVFVQGFKLRRERSCFIMARTHSPSVPMAGVNPAPSHRE